MKLNLKTEVRSQKPEARNLASDFRPPSSQRGIALIITLILLSVTLVMALAFLAITNRERGSVTTESDTATARLAADAALAHAEAQIMANILSTTNPYNFNLLVSTNYINPNGYNIAITTNDLNNVNYVDGTGAPLNVNNFLQNLNNLLYLPRAPVFISTNSSAPPDFRFYLDLNRNGHFDANGTVLETDNTGATNGVVSFQVGDPEWIGGLERPDVSHGPNNHFLYRYAFIAVPVGNGLDANYIHNQAHRGLPSLPLNSTVNPPAGNSSNPDSFIRNEGVGTWEINLAAFLADLNTNRWNPPTPWNNLLEPYQYPAALPGSSVAFDDARAILAYRYNNDFNTLNLVPNIFGANGTTAFENDNIDGFTYGAPLMTNFALPGENDFALINNKAPWAGADNTNHYFTPSDLYDPAKTAGFSTNLLNAGTNNSTYDRYTLYRLLSQLGTDSSPESGKMNINYDNLTVTNNSASATNFLPWTPLGFFTNAADRMLRTYTAFWMSGSTNNFNNFTNTFGADVTNAFGVTDIPVYVDGRFVYSPAVQRVLQLAANIYDASTTNFYPSRFKPIFRNDGTNVFISGYEQQTAVIVRDPTFGELGNFDLSIPTDASTLLNFPANADIHTNVYGVPWIIGAKKGLPNFNEFSMETAFQITRKLQYSRNTNTWQYASNQMYIMSISNYFGVECWNSYRSNYLGVGTVNPGMVDIMVRDNMAMAMTLSNDTGGLSQVATNVIYANNPNPYSVFSWPGYPSGQTNFLIPLNAAVVLVTNSIYNYGNNYGNTTYPQPGLIPTFLNPLNYQDRGTPPLPQSALQTTNRLQVAIVDYSAGVNAGQIIDYIQLNGMDASLDINAVIADPDALGLWSTNLPPSANGAPQGVVNQTTYSENGSPALTTEDLDDGGVWSKDPIPGTTLTSPTAEQFYFRKFFAHVVTVNVPTGTGTNTVVANYTSTNLQAAYTPTRTRVQKFAWQANDPLIHYLTSDLTDTANDTNSQHVIDWPANLGQLNDRYAPWGGNPANPPNPNTPDDPRTASSYNIALMDSRIYSSDYWDFPTNKYPTVGWLGRVHRGTPWQTVFLKATNIVATANSLKLWQTWTGNLNPSDANNSAPIQDRLLFDIFTTAPDDNATRGQLSVNIPSPNLAAWSALFSGIVVPTTLTNTYTIISPAAAESAVSLIPVTNTAVYKLALAIDQTRGNTNLFSLGAFPHVGDILSVPQLTEQSPFLAPPYSPSAVGPNPQNAISDEMYEWLPQQTMSLLRVGSARYVIYSYGQALKPAPNSIVTSSSFFGMVTNYQIMAESATRAVVRFDSTLTNINGTLTVTNNNAVIESFNILPPE
jgi:hypothetical protein